MAEKVPAFSQPDESDGSGLDWIIFADGDIWSIWQDKDYDSQRGVLTSMKRWANKRGYQLDRVVHKDHVEFRFVFVAPTTPLS